MKKLICLILSLLCVLPFTSCLVELDTNDTGESPSLVSGNQSNTQGLDTNPNDTDSGNAMDTEPVTFSIGDVVKLNDWNVTVNSFEFVDILQEDFARYEPDEGNKFAVIHMTIKNVGSTEQTFLERYSFEDNDAKLIYDGQYEFSIKELLSYGPDLRSCTMNPLAEKTGVIVFEVVKELTESDKPLVLKIMNNNVALNINLR